MTWPALRRLVRRLRESILTERGDLEAAREYESHLALLEEDLRAQGLRADEARRVAVGRIGAATSVQALQREARGLPWLTDARHDLRHASRMLMRAPAHTLAVLVTVAGMVALAAAGSAVFHGVLLRPLPYDAPDRLVRVWERHEDTAPVFPGAHGTDLTYHALREADLPSFDGIGAFQHRVHTVSGPQGSRQIDGAALTPSLPGVLRLVPRLGRFFLDSEANGTTHVAVLGHGLWQRSYGGAADVVGQTIVADGVAHEIVGVAPEGFAFPETDTELYTPLHMPRPTGNNLALISLVARLAPPASAAQAAEQATTVARTLPRPMVAEVLFGKGGPVRVHVQQLGAQMTAAVRPALLTLGAAVLLLVVVACANVATLSVAHALGRRHEVHIRLSMGATRPRLVRQVLTEHLALCSMGAAVGTALGVLLLRALPRLLPASFPRLETLQVDWPFVAAALTCTLVIAAVSALAAVRELSSDQGVGHRATASRTVAAGQSRLRQSLLAVESAVAVVLLVGAALLLRSFVTLMDVDAGYDPAHAVTATLHLPGDARAARSRTSPEHLATRARVETLASHLLERLRAHPDVAAAGVGTVVPFGGSLARYGFELPGTAGPDGKTVVAYAMSSIVSEGYFEALGMRLLEGRTVAMADRTAAVRAMVVNETFVRTYFDDGRPVVGRQYTGMLGDEGTVVEVVGVVRDVRHVRLDESPEPHIYLAAGGPFHLQDLALVVRTGEATGRLLEDIRALAIAVDPDVAVDNLGTLDAKVSASVATRRTIVSLLTGFAGLALLLSVTGLYGTLAHAVTTRSRELGIRAALGARRGNLIAMVVRQGVGVTTCGLLLGLVVSGLLGRTLESQLYGITPADPLSYIAAPLLLLAAALAACILPARRAARTNPALLLSTPDA